MSALKLRRTVGAVFAGAALTVTAAAAFPSSAAASPAAVPPSVVAAKLGASKVPAELVILVDISGSMTSDGLYPQVQRELPDFLAGLKQQDPQDEVAVVVFGTPADTQTVYLGPPTADITLPGSATSADTDFGYAFKQALGILSQAPSRIKVGGVLLMSDGELDAPDDPQFASYSAPGWAKLRTMEQGLGIPVTGYGLPLTTNRAFGNSVNTALGQVFTQRQTLTSDLGDVGAELNLAGQEVMGSRVAAAAAPDSGHGIRVSWIGLPGSAGMTPLNLAVGHADVKVKLTATTSRIPLSVSGLSVTSTGLPVTIGGSLPATSEQLAPGQTVTLPVHLTWTPTSGGVSLFGGTGSAQGQLTLNGQVTSPYAAAIKDTFGDQAFRVGGLADDPSATVSGTVPGQSALVVWVLIVLLVLLVVAGLVIWRARLDGRLIFTPPNKPAGELILARRPWLARPADDLIREPGRLTVYRFYGKTIRITLRLNGSVSRGVLTPGGRTWVGGIGVDHRQTQGFHHGSQRGYQPEPR